MRFGFSHSAGWGVLLFLLLLLPFWSFAQERGSSLTITVVFPLSGDRVESPLVFQGIPSHPGELTSYSVFISHAGGEAVLSADASTNWMGSWSPADGEYGPATLLFRACIREQCVEESRLVEVVRPSVAPVERVLSDVSSHRRTRPADVDDSPPSPPVFYSVTPSDFFALSEVDVSGSRVVSSGDSFLLEGGLYDFSFSFPQDSWLGSGSISRVSIQEDGLVLSRFPVGVVDYFEYRGDYFSVSSLSGYAVGFPFAEGRFTLPVVEGQRLFACMRFDESSHSCLVTWSPVSIQGEDWSFSFDSPRFVLARAVRMDSPPLPIPIHSVQLSNVVGDFYGTSSSGRVGGPWSTERVSLGEGLYTFDLDFLDSPIGFLRAEDVNINHSGTLFAQSPFLSEEVGDGEFQWVLSHDFVSVPSSFRFSRRVDPSTVRFCDAWSVETNRCISSWVDSPVRSIPPGVSSVRYRERTVESPGEVPDANLGVVDPLLVQAIADLKQVHTNKRFFLSPQAQRSLEALRVLFSEVEVSLECGPPSDSPIPFTRDVSVRSAVPSLELRDDPVPSFLSLGVPSPYWNADSPAFYSNEWEDFVLIPDSWRQREGVASCDGVRLQNQFEFAGSVDTPKKVYLGASPHRVKQSLTLTNDTDAVQVRRVNIRLESPFRSLQSDSNVFSPSPQYWRVPSRIEHTEVLDSSIPELGSYSFSTIKDSFLRLADDNGNFKGTYDWSDFLNAGYSPQTLVHDRDGQTVIETLLAIRIPPFSSVVVDPIYDLNLSANYSVRFAGGVTRDYLGITNTNFGALTTNPQSLGVEWVNVDNNSYANDLLINSVYADANGKVDVGAIYLIRDVDYRSGSLDLNSSLNYNIRWNGRTTTDRIGYPQIVGDGMQLVDLDGNGYTNDLIITASFGDYNSSNVGFVMTILDIDKKPNTGTVDLNFTSNFNAMWYGKIASDNVGYTNQSAQGARVENLDGNSWANDLVIVSTLFNGLSRTDAGAIHIILDAYKKSGLLDLNFTTSSNIQIYGSRASDFMGGVFQSSDSVFFKDINGDGAPNDMVIACGSCDNSSSNTGSIFVIMDINARSGTLDLNLPVNYNFRVIGRGTSDGLATAGFSGPGVIIADTDGNGVTNDLIISAPSSNQAGTTRGAIYYLRDIANMTGDHNVASSSRVNLTIVGATNADQIGLTFGSGQGVQLVNADNNVVANDLLITSYLHNAGLTDNGAVYYINDINRRSGTLTLNTTTSNYTALFQGGFASDFLGDTNMSGPGTILANLDGNAWANDLLIGANMANASGTAAAGTDAGAVYMVLDIHKRVGNFSFASQANYNARFSRHTDRQAYLTNARGFGRSIQVYDLDGNGYANDVILLAPFADTNAKTDAGAVHLIMNINTFDGNVDLNTAATSPTTRAWTGSHANDWLGHNAGSGPAVKVRNMDNNAYANDLIIIDSNGDGLKTNAGAVYFIQDIASIPPGYYDLNHESSFTKAWFGGESLDMLGMTFGSLDGDQNVDIDNNGYRNDLLLTAVAADVNNKANSGAVYLLRDVVVAVSTSQDYSFVLNLPSSGCTVGKGNLSGGSTCQRGYIVTTDTNVLSDENKVNPEGQSTTVPFFVYDNQSTSSSDLNIYLDINASLPSSLRLKVSKIYEGWAYTCTGNTDTNCVQLTTSQQSVGKASYSAGSADLNLFIWGDFNAASVGTTDVNVDSNAGSST